MGGPKIVIPPGPAVPAAPPPAPTPPSLAQTISFNKKSSVGPASGSGILGGTFMTGAQGSPSNTGLKTLTGT